ncbi:asparagine synthase (glutamine-hydrolyzing) [Penaeicola halotolerans]|uniref:asparagine synthase (glutamine-hydrolyzing) n=1 Tax=Penaeicola halotolerans TaxID=2793196 RepID=UPI001CF85ECA|nr:asparagine synthase (glutamine-hydrolyzing) [Penaeicola halotolerans]
MCGINVIWSREAQSQAIQQMAQATLHRGPDHTGTIHLQQDTCHLHLSVNRLKILDPHDRSNQPFCPDGKKNILAWNGEIYNYQDLKNELLTEGGLFETTSDTEVLYHVLDHWGIAGLSRVSGMFAISWLDQSAQKLYLIRDRSGMKPLYYYHTQDILVTSSEIKGIFASGSVDKVPNKRQFANYLSYRFAIAPETLFKDIFCLLPSQILCLDLQTGSIDFEKVPTFQSSFSPASQDLRSTLKEKLQDSLLKHLSADKSVGIFLSGGVDSTLLLALNHDLKNPPIRSYSIAFEKSLNGLGLEDDLYAKKAVAKYSHESFHTQLTITKELLKARQEDFYQTYLDDQPVADTAALLTYLLSEKASEHSTVLLNGAGADEYFLGYNRHKAFAAYMKHPKRWSFLSRLFKGFPLLPAPLRKMLQDISEDPSETWENFFALTPAYKTTRTKLSAVQDVHHLTAFETSYYLPMDLLAIADQLSMRHSVEMRLPYLDDDLLAFISKHQATLLTKTGEKTILKSLLEELGGQVFTKRKKQGFGIPLTRWMAENFSVDQLTSLYQDILRISDISESDYPLTLASFIAQAKQQPQFFWAHFSLVKWYKLNFGE